MSLSLSSPSNGSIGSPPRIGLLTRQGSLAQEIAKLSIDNKFAITCIDTIEALLDLAATGDLDIALLDWSEHNSDTINCCTALHAKGSSANIPVIVLSSRCDESSVLQAFDAGADDYLGIPLSISELAARLVRILWRAKPNVRNILTYGNVSMNLDTGRVARAGRYLELHPSEHKLLRAFMERPVTVVPRERLLQIVCERPSLANPRTIDVYVRRLRRALRSSQLGNIIRTVPPIGYSLDVDAVNYSLNGCLREATR